MSAQLEREPPQLLQLDTGSGTVTVLMWLNASRVVTAAILRIGEARPVPRTLLSTAVPIKELEAGVEVSPDTLGLQLPGVSLGLATPANLAYAREWFQLHGVDVRRARS